MLASSQLDLYYERSFHCADYKFPALYEVYSTNIQDNFFYFCTVHSGICTVHSPTNALFYLKNTLKFILKYT